jgi:signal transduction histidine kinase/CheY-like chemotaxis protein/HPt (histidine-containing phosphotransfer) domain-containing protein
MALEDSPFIRKAFKTEKEIHIALGFLLGCLISALITYIEAEWSLTEITLAGLWQVHISTPACWVADLAPVAIAFYSWYGSRKIDMANRAATDANERYEQMAVLRQMAESSSRSKSEFLANMSHEIRTPMNAIIGMNYLMGKTPLSEKQVDYHRKIDVSAKNLLRIIDDILDFSKIEAGKLTLENDTMAIAEVVSEVADAVNVKLQHKSEVEFITYVDVAIPRYVLGDSLRLRQVLLNLTDNAAKFTERGEIRVMAKLLKSLPYGCIVNFSIRDSGIGITETQLQNLFNPFQQADLSTTRKYGGTGLGLTICRRIVEMMDGELTATSESGVGSDFTFNAFFSNAEAPEESLPMPNYGLTALLADDSESARMVLTEMLESLGFNVLVAENAPDAKKIWNDVLERGEEIALLVVDWKMPGMTGLELVKDIKDGAPEKVPSVVMVTSHGAEAVRDALNKNLVDGLLIKPIGISTLNDTIADVLQQDQRRMRSQREEIDYMELYRQHLKGVRLLLVEDNEINMDLATELLEDVGAHVDSAVNGIMAVEMIQGQSYDLVLMDIQMPEMDGLTATREIRTRMKADELPIVAMTAHAIKGEYEKSLAAGMNDHITKPIDPDVLYRTLIKHIRGISMDMVTASGAEKTKSAIQIAGLKYEEGLKRSGSKRASYHALLLKFGNRYVNVATEVRTMVMNSDVAGLADYLHTLAGVSGNVGATDAYELASKLSVQLKSSKEAGERKIRVDLISQMQLLTVKLDELIRSIRDKIKPEVATRDSAKETVERNWSELATQLKATIAENDSVALDMIEDALSNGSEGPAMTCLKEVQLSLSDFNFDKALEQINRGIEEGLFR